MTSTEGGSVLVSMAGLASLTAVMVTGGLILADQAGALAARREASVRAVVASSSGVEVAMAVLASSNVTDGTGTDMMVALADGTAIRLGTPSAADGTRVVTVTAVYGGSVHTVEVRVTASGGP